MSRAKFRLQPKSERRAVIFELGFRAYHFQLSLLSRGREQVATDVIFNPTTKALK